MGLSRSHLRKPKKFKVRKYYEQLSEKKGELFHLVVEKFVFIMKRYIPDSEKAVIFLMKRVPKSDVDYWGKLRRVSRFVHFTLKGKRCFGGTNLDKIFTWVDASYVVHNDMKSNNGWLMSMVLGITHCILIKKIWT